MESQPKTWLDLGTKGAHEGGFLHELNAFTRLFPWRSIRLVLPSMDPVARKDPGAAVAGSNPVEAMPHADHATAAA